MPRKAREGSGTGIFHVMMRGTNHQNIFDWYLQMKYCCGSLKKNLIELKGL